MSINLPSPKAFTDEDWARVECDWAAWWAGELDRPMVVIQYDQTPPGADLPDAPAFLTNLPPDLTAEAIIDRYHARLEHTRWAGDAFPKWHPNYGPGIGAAFLGCRVRPAPDTVWFEPPRSVPLEDLHFEYDSDNPWWRRVRDVTRAAVGRWGRDVAVAHTDIGGNLDILASFRPVQDLLTDLLDAPHQVDRLVREITSLWLRYYRELDDLIRPTCRGTTPWAPIFSNGACYMLQCDFCYMISPAMFQRFVLPDLAASCDALDHAFYHLDGKGALPHLDTLLAIDRLRGIQWIPGTGAPEPEHWPDVLSRIRNAGKFCQLYVTPDAALKIVRDHSGKGFAFQIWGGDGGVPLHMTDQRADDLIQAINREHRRSRRR